MTSLVEQEYQARIRAMSIPEKIERSSAMLNFTRNAIAQQIVAAEGEMSVERLKLKVALRLYQADPGIVKMIEQRLHDVPA